MRCCKKIMEHNTCKENLSAYLDGELPAGEKLSLESHLASCADCSRELAELKRVSAVFKKHVMQPVPAALKEAVFAEKSAKPFFLGWFKPVLVLAAAAASLLVILGLPKLRDHEPIALSELSSKAYYQTEGLKGASELKRTAPSGSFSGGMSATVAGRGGASPAKNKRLAAPAPALNTSGAFGQAKFASRAVSKADEVSSPAAAFITGEASVSSLSSLSPEEEADSKSFSPVSAEPVSVKKISARPKWVDDLIRKYQAGQQGNPPLAVWRYSYKGRKVYYLPPQCCDQYSALYNEAGKLLCAPDGGKTGHGDGKCPKFFKLRKAGELIWQDSRGR